MRQLVLVALAVLAVGCQTTPKAGNPCDTNASLSCDGTQAIFTCVSKVWASVPCEGPTGCRASGSTATCDNAVATSGKACPPWLEGKQSCQTGPSGVLACSAGTWRLVTQCPASCSTSGGTATCVGTHGTGGGTATGGGSGSTGGGGAGSTGGGSTSTGGGNATGGGGSSGTCDASSCPSGCCSNGQCLSAPLNSTTNFCGTAGATCADCGAAGQRCDDTSFTCVAATSCDKSTCAGCCANGQCFPVPLNSTLNFCGTGGNACSDCGEIGLLCDAKSFSCVLLGAGGGAGTGGGSTSTGGGTTGTGGGTADPCPGIPIGGQCVSASLLRFCSIPTGSGTPTIQTYQCATGTTCQPTGSGAACLPPAQATCAAKDSRCANPTSLQTCGTSGTWNAPVSCPSGVCVDSAIGGDCGVAVATVNLTGTLKYETRAPLANLSDWGDPTAVPAVNVFVTSQRGGKWVHTTTTDASGQFTVKVPASPISGDTLLFTAWGGDGVGLRYQVADPQFGPGSQQVGQHVSNPRVWSWSQPTSSVANNATITITAAQGSGALNIFDLEQRVWAQALRLNGGKQGLSVVMWLGLGTTWSCGACFSPQPEAGLASQVWMPGDSANQGYWSDYTIAHELGHWEMASYGTSPNEGGSHYIMCPTFPGQAWSEGYATWHSAATRDTSRLEDKQGGNFFWFDLGARSYFPSSSMSSAIAPAAGISCGAGSDCASGQIDENLVASLLWSISKSRASGMGEIFNAVASTHLNTAPWPQGYTRHTWNVSQTSCDKLNVSNTGQNSLHLADAFDTLLCGGLPTGSNAIPPATITAADTLNGTNWYPYPVGSPSCRNGFCYGCLQGSTCTAGNQTSACGTGGTGCVSCSSGQSCVNGVCQ